MAAAPPSTSYTSSTPSTNIAIKADGGVAFAPGHRLGGFGRLGAEVIVAPYGRRPGPIYGMWDAFEGWSNGANGGGSFPIVFFAGLQSPHVFATLGAGVNVITIDGVRDARAAGLFSPRAQARIGLQAGHLFLAASAEVQRRWRWVLDDLTLFQGGISIGFVAEDKGR